MIVDSSAILAILFRQQGFEVYLDQLLSDPAPAVGAPTLAEIGIVLTARLGENASGLLERFLNELGIQEIPFGELHWREAVSAYRRFGQGRHEAALSFGDCLTYAVAALAGEPLLHAEGDFARTDLKGAG
jgi:ribonuclease VapC